MKTRVVGGAMLAVWCSLQAFGQVGIWQNYTSMQEVRAVARAGTTVWAATSGGLFAWTEGSDSYRRITTADGLQTTDLTAVAVDGSGDVWTGTSTGIIHVFSPSTSRWRYIPDIAGANQTDKRINSLVITGDTVLVCTNFGLSVFRISRFEFGDTYTRFGTLTGNVRVAVQSAVLFDNMIRATVSDGQTSRVASGNITTNLLPPEAWTLQTLGGPANIPTSLAIFNNTVYAGTTSGLFFLQSGAWTAYDSLAGANIVDLDAGGGTLAIATAANTVNTITSAGFTRFGATVPGPVNAVVVSSSGKPIAATATSGVMTYETSWTSHFPNGPGSNQFLSVAVDQDGKVWGAGGINGAGKGFYRFDGTSWKTFNKQNSPLPTDDYYRVSLACNGDVWIGSWLHGVVLMPRGADAVDTSKIYGRNVGMSGILEDSALVVVGPAICDQNGNTWMSVMKVRDKHPIAIRSAGGTWSTIACYIAGSPQIYLSERDVTKTFAVDAQNNIWATAVTDGNKGIVSLNNRGSLTDSVANVFLNSTNGLPSDIVTCIVADRDNNLWVGTDRGIGIILDPSNPLRSGGIATYRPLSGLGVNAIAVDPLNQKWVATNEGAILLSRDGTQTLAQYNVASTGGKIIDNTIRDVAIDPKTGTVYFATLSGLASLTTTSVEPKTDFGDITVSPNPYRIPNALPLTIDGLVENSVIKILTIDGHLVREFTTPGGRIGFWDGRDESGKDVASGIYIIVAYSETQKDKVGTGKVAVLRR